MTPSTSFLLLSLSFLLTSSQDVSDSVAIALTGQQFLSSNLPWSQRYVIGSHRAYDFSSVTNNGFQEKNSQIYPISKQISSLGVEAITIDVHFIGNFSTGTEVTSDNFRSCVSAFPVCGDAMYVYCSAGSNKTSANKKCSSNPKSNWDACASQGVVDYGSAFTGCRSDSPRFESVMNDIANLVIDLYIQNRTLVIFLDDYTTNFQSDSKFSYADIQREFHAILDRTVTPFIYPTDPRKDYSVAFSWPTPSAMITARKPLLVFSTNAFNVAFRPLLFDAAFFQINTVVTLPKSCPDKTAFYFTEGNSVTYEYTNPVTRMDCPLFASSGAVTRPITNNHVQFYKSCDVSQFFDRLDVSAPSMTLWAWPSTGITSADSQGRFCFALNWGTGRLDTHECGEVLPILCRKEFDPYAWLVTEYRDSMDVDEDPLVCPTGYIATFPRRPSELQSAYTSAQQHFAQSNQKSWHVWVNLVLDRSCFFSPSLPFAQCHSAPFSPSFPPNKGDDDMDGGEIAATVILSVFGAVLLAALLLYLVVRPGSAQTFTGSGPTRSVDNVDA